MYKKSTDYIVQMDNQNSKFIDFFSTIDLNAYRIAIETDIGNINKRNFSLEQWARFKQTLLIYEKDWQLEIFKWTGLTNLTNPECPYVGFDIIWDRLGNDHSKYILLHMALEHALDMTIEDALDMAFEDDNNES